MRTIVIYPGRFEPFCPHHFAVYRNLVKKFGDNVYITTSNKVDTLSPLNFNEKKSIITQYGIPADKIVHTTQPYKSTELLSRYNQNEYSVIFALGKKDANRIQFTKKDGTSGYFSLYKDGVELQPINQTGYVYITPNITIKMPDNTEMSGTKVRGWIGKSTPESFKKLFGWYNPGLYNLMKKKFNVDEDINVPINVGDTVLGGRFKNKKIKIKDIGKNDKGDITINGKPLLKVRINSKINESGTGGHIQHPYDDLTLKFSDIKELIKTTLSGHMTIKNATEKMDGQSLSITYINGQFRCARNKTDILNPMSLHDLISKFDGRGTISDSFTKAMQFMIKNLDRLSDSLLNKFFKNGKVFLGIEIIYESNKNVLDYSGSYIVFLNMNEYDEDGKIIQIRPDYAKKLKSIIDNVNDDLDDEFNIRLPNNIQLNKAVNYNEDLTKFLGMVTKLQNKFQLSDSDTIGDYYSSYYHILINKLFPKLTTDATDILLRRWVYDKKTIKLNSNLFTVYYEELKQFENEQVPKINSTIKSKFEFIFLQLGIEVLSNITSFFAPNPSDTIQKIRKDLLGVIKQIKSSDDPRKLDLLKTQLGKIKKLGGFNKIAPSEGIVFKYNGKTYKLTGMFAPINQLLGIIKYNR